MSPLWPLLGVFGLVVIPSLLITLYLRRRDGYQPGFTRLFILAALAGCVFLGVYGLERFGLDLQHGSFRIVFYLALGVFQLFIAVFIVYRRVSSGAVLMDLGPAPLSKFFIAIAILEVAIGIGLAFEPGSRPRAFTCIACSAWMIVMARSRFQVRERGITISDRVPWNRINRCVATAENMVRLNLNKGLQRVIDIKLPVASRDEFVQLVNARLAS